MTAGSDDLELLAKVSYPIHARSNRFPSYAHNDIIIMCVACQLCAVAAAQQSIPQRFCAAAAAAAAAITYNAIGCVGLPLSAIKHIIIILITVRYRMARVITDIIVNGKIFSKTFALAC